MRIRRFNENYQIIDWDEWSELKPESLETYECSQLEEFVKSLGSEWSIEYYDDYHYRAAKLIKTEKRDLGFTTKTIYCEIEQTEDRWIALSFNNSPYWIQEIITSDDPFVKCETIQDSIQFIQSLLDKLKK